MRRLLLATITLAVGLIVLAGYFFRAALAPILSLLVDWGVLLAGVTGLIGIGYLVKRHFTKLFNKTHGSFYSVFFLVAFFFTLMIGLLLSLEDILFQSLVLNVQIPVEASLLGILAVTLMYTGMRLIRIRGWTLMSIAFLASAVFSLVFQLGIIHFHNASLAAELLNFFQRLPLAGIRGLLLGMALGGLVIGLRVLLTIDRPYGE